jgi:hypothetical protein
VTANLAARLAARLGWPAVYADIADALPRFLAPDALPDRAAEDDDPAAAGPSYAVAVSVLIQGTSTDPPVEPTAFAAAAAGRGATELVTRTDAYPSTKSTVATIANRCSTSAIVIAL